MSKIPLFFSLSSLLILLESSFNNDLFFPDLRLYELSFVVGEIFSTFSTSKSKHFEIFHFFLVFVELSGLIVGELVTEGNMFIKTF